MTGPGPHADPAAALVAAVVTCSDSAAAGEAFDVSGPLAAELLEALGHPVTSLVVVPDEVAGIVTAVRTAAARGARIVVCTGGTGPGPRDVTPEALRAAGLRELPGLGEAIRAAGRVRVPTADLSRSLGGVLAGIVVLALPGNPGAVRDSLEAVGPLLGHAAVMAAGGGHGPRTSAAHAADGDPADPDPTGDPPLVADPLPIAARIVPALVRATPITEGEVAAEVAREGAGAVVTFAGVVRDDDGGRTVEALHYEDHPDAERILAEVVLGATQRPGVLAAAARHRVGTLAVGELAFTAAVSAAHRAQAFEGCAWLVDEVKARLPIWKHQRFADGTDEWVNSP